MKNYVSQSCKVFPGSLFRAMRLAQHLRFVLPILLMMLLAACDARIIAYKGTCAQQTQQFSDYIHSLVLDELSPVIEDGFYSGPNADVMKRLQALDTRISE